MLNEEPQGRIKWVSTETGQEGVGITHKKALRYLMVGGSRPKWPDLVCC